MGGILHTQRLKGPFKWREGKQAWRSQDEDMSGGTRSPVGLEHIV